ncbi:MAG: hypothetical protein ACXV97_01690 [Chthoniobacterales bacterium]
MQWLLRSLFVMVVFTQRLNAGSVVDVTAPTISLGAVTDNVTSSGTFLPVPGPRKSILTGISGLLVIGYHLRKAKLR